MCLLSLLCATIQLILLCACPAFYMPQYSRAYCVPAQPSICHNTAEPTVCLLNLPCAAIQLSLLLCACSTCCMPQYNIPFSNPSWSQYNPCIVTQYLSQPNQPPQSQYNRCIVTHLSPSQNCTTVTIQFVVLQYSSQSTTHLSCNIAIQFSSQTNLPSHCVTIQLLP